MIIVKIFAGIIMFLTIAIAGLSLFFEPYDPNAQEIISTDAQAVIGTEPVVVVERRRGAVVCKFDPITDSPQQFAADYLFGELLREGDIYSFAARVAVPSGGYTASFGSMTMSGSQVVLEANLNRPAGQALEMIDTVSMQRNLRFPPEALTLRVVLKRNFAWGPDAIICSIVRPSELGQQPVNPAPPPAPSAQPAPVRPVLPPAPAPVPFVPAPPQ